MLTSINSLTQRELYKIWGSGNPRIMLLAQTLEVFLAAESGDAALVIVKQRNEPVSCQETAPLVPRALSGLIPI